MTVRFNSVLLFFALAQPLQAWEMPSLSPKTWFTVGCGVYGLGTLFCGYKLIKKNAEYNRQKTEFIKQTDEYNKQKAAIENRYNKSFTDHFEETKRLNNDDHTYFPSPTPEGQISFYKIADQFDLTTVVDGQSHTKPNDPEWPFQHLAATKFDEKPELKNPHFETKKRLNMYWSDNANGELKDLEFRQSLIPVPTKFNIDTEEKWRKTFEHYKYVHHFRVKYEAFHGKNGATFIEKTPKFYKDQETEISNLKKPMPVKLKKFNAADKAAFGFIVAGAAGLLGLGYKHL